MGILERSLPSGMEADLDSIDTTNTGGQYRKVEKASVKSIYILMR